MSAATEPGIGAANRQEEAALAEDHGPSVKNDELYEKLRDEGESKEKSARIAGAGEPLIVQAGRGSRITIGISRSAFRW